MTETIRMQWVLKMLTTELDDLPDERKPSNNRKYKVKEALLSAVSACFLQSRSFLDHQRLMKSQKGRDNASSLFGISEIPCANQIRNLLLSKLRSHLLNSTTERSMTISRHCAPQ